MKKNTFACLILTLIAWCGCASKTQDNPLTASELLTQGEWTSVVNLDDIDLDGTFVEFGDDCEKDDHSIFDKNNKFQQNSGLDACDSSTAPNSVIAEGDWELLNNDQNLVLKFPADEIKFNIIQINDHELQLGLIEDNNPAGVITQKLILKR